MTAVDLRVYAPDGATLIDPDPLPRRRGVTWLHEMNADGTGQVDLRIDDPLLLAKPELLDDGNIVKVRPAGYPSDVFGWRITDVTRAEVQPAEGAGRWVTVQGPGVRSVCPFATVAPELLRLGSSDNRVFDFSSPDGSWRDVPTWGVPVGVRQDADPTARARNPQGWPDPPAQWLWSSDPTVSAPAGRNYFRSKPGSFVLDEDAMVTVYASGDNQLSLRLDSEVVISTEATDWFAWRTTQTYTTLLAAGEHRIAAWVDNFAQLVGNPGAFLCTVAIVDGSGNPVQVVLRSTPDTFDVRGYGDPPGWHGAQILETLFGEAQTRGVAKLAGVTLGFTGLLDSAGIGWTDLQDKTFRVGDDYAQVVAQVAELAMDTDMSPDLVFDAWNRRGQDLIGDVELLPTDAIASLPVRRTGGIRNALLVRFAGGWVEVTVPASIAAFGRAEAPAVTVGNADSIEQAIRVGEATLEELAWPQVTQPITMTSLRGPQPELDFGLGDTIVAPAWGGAQAPGRVMSIGGAESEDGQYLNWDLDLYPTEV